MGGTPLHPSAAACPGQRQSHEGPAAVTRPGGVEKLSGERWGEEGHGSPPHPREQPQLCPMQSNTGGQTLHPPQPKLPTAAQGSHPRLCCWDPSTARLSLRGDKGQQGAGHPALPTFAPHQPHQTPACCQKPCFTPWHSLVQLPAGCRQRAPGHHCSGRQERASLAASPAPLTPQQSSCQHGPGYQRVLTTDHRVLARSQVPAPAVTARPGQGCLCTGAIAPPGC